MSEIKIKKFKLENSSAAVEISLTKDAISKRQKITLFYHDQDGRSEGIPFPRNYIMAGSVPRNEVKDCMIDWGLDQTQISNVLNKIREYIKEISSSELLELEGFWSVDQMLKELSDKLCKACKNGNKEILFREDCKCFVVRPEIFQEMTKEFEEYGYPLEKIEKILKENGCLHRLEGDVHYKPLQSFGKDKVRCYFIKRDEILKRKGDA